MRPHVVNATTNTFAEMAVQEYHAAQEAAGTSIEATARGLRALRALVRGIRLPLSTVIEDGDCIFVTLMTTKKPVASKAVSLTRRAVHLEHSAAI